MVNIRRQLNKLNWKFKNNSNKIQNISAIVGTVGVLAALSLSLYNYHSSQLLEARNIKRDSTQTNLLDSIAKQIKMQSDIAKDQYDAQLELNKPILALSNFSYIDTIKYDSINLHGLSGRIPYISCNYVNKGARSAVNVFVNTRFYYYHQNAIFNGKTHEAKSRIAYQEGRIVFTTPFKPIQAKQFISRYILGYTDELTNKIIVDTIYLGWQFLKENYRISYPDIRIINAVQQMDTSRSVMKLNPTPDFMKKKVKLYNF